MPGYFHSNTREYIHHTNPSMWEIMHIYAKLRGYFLFSQVSRLKYPGMVVLGGDTTLTNSSTGPNINMVVSRDPDMTALWRLVTPQILGLTNSPLETAFLLG